MPETRCQANSCTTSLGLQLHTKTIMPPKYAALLHRKVYLAICALIVELKIIIILPLQVTVNSSGYYLIILLINMKGSIYFLVYML